MAASNRELSLRLHRSPLGLAFAQAVHDRSGGTIDSRVRLSATSGRLGETGGELFRNESFVA